MTGIITATVCVSVTGLLIGIFLGLAGKKFAVASDERALAIEKALPGNNCGGCGYAGCSALASAISAGEADPGACPVGGKSCAEKISAIMGVKAGSTARMTAFVKCAGDCESAPRSYDYSGLVSCRMRAGAPGGGDKACSYGCLGGGDCVRACQFGAIHVEDDLAIVDEELCRACGKCVSACPRGLIELVKADSHVRVACSSKAKGPAAMKVCKSACIGCSLCKKACENDAVIIEDNLARIDYSKCIQCGACVEKCPRKAIIV